MGIGVCLPIFDKDGNPTVLPSGTWFCYECKKKRKTIYYPYTGTIEERCKCGSMMVFQQE